MEKKQTLKHDRVGLYVIKDVVADDIAPVFQAHNDAVALRQFNQLIRESYEPTDYELHKVAELTKDMVVFPINYRIDSIEEEIKQFQKENKENAK